jgi:hypothetical protein
VPRIRTILVFLLVIASAAPLLVPSIYTVRLAHIHFEMKEKLEREHLVTLSIPVQEFRWYEQDKEIILDNRMFDVRELQRVGNHYLVKGLYDDEETALEQQVIRMQEREDNNSGQAAQLASLLFSPAEPDLQIPFVPGVDVAAADKETDHLHSSTDPQLGADLRPPRLQAC